MQTETQHRPFNLGRANVLSKLATSHKKQHTRNNLGMIGSQLTKQPHVASAMQHSHMPSTKIKDVQFKYYKYRRMLRKLRLEEMPKNLNKDESGQFK